MPVDFAHARPLLRGCDLPKLFVNHLGWEPCHQKLTLSASGINYSFTAIAEKRGFIIWECENPDGGLPDHETRLKLDRLLAQTSFEHLIVFVTGDRSRQSWMWIKREPGRPLSPRTHEYSRSQPGDSLLQKLQLLFVSLEEEEAGILITQMSSKAKAAFDLEHITKRFYDQFKKEHTAFLKFIKGIEEQADREWYASVMLNRLMFVYFIQRKGFLDGDQNYLRNRLRRCQAEHGKDKFYSFYTYFLLRLFLEGFGSRTRTSELEKLLGRIPYLNGGLFDIHELEKKYSKDIQIPDKAFEQIFGYFDSYDWVLDPQRTVKEEGDKEEINPDVLGYIFEKYINQKQMGAYYTKEDITEYICKNTVLPFLLDAARAKCKVAFENPNGPTVWDLLRADPDRYIYPVVRHGVSWNYDPKHTNKGEPLDKPFALPKDIAEGLDTAKPDLIERRKGWNKPAPKEYALPTEIWREVVNRRKRYEELRRKLAAGELRDINDLIALNLDIRQFAQDVIVNCEGPDLLRAFWHTIEKVTVLDPTCGSGAFLFAALNILEPLYERCLDRMESFIADLERSGEKHRPEKFSDFRTVLERVDAHPNRPYFILKSIILNNLYGVDIMEEAVEICKLRLFLKLAAQVDPEPARNNLGIEPLPDIDFNIRPGNTLVGFATYEDVKKAVTSKLDFDDAMETISTKAADLQQTFDAFRRRQIEGDGSVPAEHKQELRQRLKALDGDLNGYLANEYGVNPKKKEEYTKWLKSHQPFHWFIEFHRIVSDGGFDVIIGNPPFVVYTPEKVAYRIIDGLFKTSPCKNLYPLVFERSLQLAHRNSSLGLIVQLTALSSEKMAPLQELLIGRGFLLAPSFPRRPESIFDGVEMPVAILISRATTSGIFTSRVSRFYTEERPQAINVIRFQKHSIREDGYRVGKLAFPNEVEILRKIQSFKPNLESLTTSSSKHVLYYQEACRYWAKACKGYPFFRRNGKHITPPHGRVIYFNSSNASAFAACLMNSTLFYWYYSCLSDCEHINDTLIRSFKIPDSWIKDNWLDYEETLAKSLRRNSERKTITTKQGHKIEYDELDASKSKEAIDKIDQALAQHYGCTHEELDFITNYDIKYRMGRDAGIESEEE